MFCYCILLKDRTNKRTERHIEHFVIPTYSFCVFLDSGPIRCGVQPTVFMYTVRLNNQLLWVGGLLFCFISMHKFSILLTDCCLPSLRTHTHTLVLLYKRRQSEAVCDEFVQSYANACPDDIPKSRQKK